MSRIEGTTEGLSVGVHEVRVRWGATMLVVFALVFAGCTSKKERAAEQSAPEVVNSDAELAELGTATISGTVKLLGRPPASNILKVRSDPACAERHPDGLRDDHYKVGKDGALSEAVVYIAAGLADDATFASSPEPVVIDQDGCRYVPKVLALGVGQPLRILNSDPTFHNVAADAEHSDKFNLAMPTRGGEETRRFMHSEMGIELHCHVHPWMVAYANVFAHPFFDVTDAAGAFTLERVPAGTFRVGAWHPRLGRLFDESVRVSDGVTRTLEFVYDLREEGPESRVDSPEPDE